MTTTLTDAQVELYMHGKKWTGEEFDQLSKLFPDQRYELIEGNLISKMGQGPSHIRLLIRLNMILSTAFPGRVSIQSGISLTDQEEVVTRPEPDVVLLNKDLTDFTGTPGLDDIALIIEVADSTLALDLDVKARLYSRCGIPEYWVVDIPNRRVVGFRNPGPTEYAEREDYALGYTVTAMNGQLRLGVRELFEGAGC